MFKLCARKKKRRVKWTFIPSNELLVYTRLSPWTMFNYKIVNICAVTTIQYLLFNFYKNLLFTIRKVNKFQKKCFIYKD